MKLFHFVAVIAALTLFANLSSAGNLYRADVVQAVQAAEAAIAKSDKEKFTWKSTKGVLAKAKEALQVNDLATAMYNAGLAMREAQQALEQKRRNKKAWVLAVPK